jgi:hypothetical protein
MTNTIEPRVGSTLHNGATVLAALNTGTRCLVLADCSKPDRAEYATWAIGLDGHCHWGHYFSDLTKAAEDLVTR